MHCLIISNLSVSSLHLSSVLFLLISYFLFCFSSTGSNSISEELPEAHGVFYAANLTNCMEYSDWKCSFISFTISACTFYIHCFLFCLLTAAFQTTNPHYSTLQHCCMDVRTSCNEYNKSKMFLSPLFTYVRTEVNYTEEVDDPVDSDGESFISSHPLKLLFLSV